ncbi:hypothetical protein [Chenggangzhangella methanolivorans]|uniref:Uncharacterized protein n=1 Tax=Chenggangzhangella methanolivorans TaxID=1437009 RepID=A0A9E6RE93_9HYPH|nr:hypothetical protein [Chenggangzhangella methanolivorans]QZO01824.1 hypothetical protein K6K41_10955 [Chenggangzhangella methanolivorans]
MADVAAASGRGPALKARRSREVVAMAAVAALAPVLAAFVGVAVEGTPWAELGGAAYVRLSGAGVPLAIFVMAMIATHEVVGDPTRLAVARRRRAAARWAKRKRRLAYFVTAPLVIALFVFGAFAALPFAALVALFLLATAALAAALVALAARPRAASLPAAAVAGIVCCRLWTDAFDAAVRLVG